MIRMTHTQRGLLVTRLQQLIPLQSRDILLSEAHNVATEFRTCEPHPMERGKGILQTQA